MKLTEPSTYLGSTTGHMIAGGLSVLFTYWIMKLIGISTEWTLIIPVLCALTRESYQSFLGQTDFKRFMQGLAEWFFGGYVFWKMMDLSW